MTLPSKLPMILHHLTGSLISALFLGVMLVGCDRNTADSKAPPATETSSYTGTGIIRGTVTLAGKAPVMATIPNQPCHDGAEPFKEETVVADESGHLQNVIVFLEDPPPSPRAREFPPIVLDQVNCRYVPHVVALRTRQPLHVTSSDPTLHNVHGMSTANVPFNFALVAPGQSRDLSFLQPELFPVRCDVHPWMKAYVQIFTHPFFAVTDKNGHFEIRNVPPGTYTLESWQEKYGVLRQTVKVDDATTVDASFKFESGL